MKGVSLRSETWMMAISWANNDLPQIKKQLGKVPGRTS